MVSKFHTGLSQDLSLMLKVAEDYNIIIKVGENQEFHAHSNILRARSPYFKSTLSTNWNNTMDNNVIEIIKPNIHPTVFEIILKYIYIGEVDLTKNSGEDILGLLVASYELLLEELFKHVQNYLIEKKNLWLNQNLVLVLHTVFKLASCKKLQDYCLDSICADPLPFFTSNEFPSLEKDILHSLLKRDDLQIEESVAWDHLIKWGVNQTPCLGSSNSDRAKWDDKCYEALKQTLEQYIPLIRFLDISSADFFDKVRPYKSVLPHQIFEEAMEFYMKQTLPKTTALASRKTPIFDKRYKFELLYRSSRDGLNDQSFGKMCNVQDPFIVLVKQKSSEKIYGGYNPLGFRNGSKCFASESFIFSFANDKDITNMNVCHLKYPPLREKCKRTGWPYDNYSKVTRRYDTEDDECDYTDDNTNRFNFGNTFYMNGQYVYLIKNSGFYDVNFTNSTKTKFIPEEIEVFKVKNIFN
ncbi:4512_t:CDS:2 [Funneliformis mosseae]|uniref:4512_t:CDS:1 n=1 Tax=Funneliformis mosseae TaxID=27381 RepID=A0A9N8V9W3_FUNMO|nr:4512_t:CDS:2 [Funneliformis mosseae]